MSAPGLLFASAGLVALVTFPAELQCHENERGTAQIWANWAVLLVTDPQIYGVLFADLGRRLGPWFQVEYRTAGSCLGHDAVRGILAVCPKFLSDRYGRPSTLDGLELLLPWKDSAGTFVFPLVYARLDNTLRKRGSKRKLEGEQHYFWSKGLHHIALRRSDDWNLYAQSQPPYVVVDLGQDDPNVE